jgi:hypothetical protein
MQGTGDLGCADDRQEALRLCDIGALLTIAMAFIMLGVFGGRYPVPGFFWRNHMKIRTVFAMGLFLALLGCSKVTLENYDKIAVGMSYDEVTQLLGTPDQCDDVMGVRNCKWGDEKRSVNVSFVADKVLLFSSSNLK